MALDCLTPRLDTARMNDTRQPIDCATAATKFWGTKMTKLRISTTAGITGVLFLLISGFMSTPGNAQTVPINAFYGKWIGSGVSQSESSIAFRYSHRDLNVTVIPAGSGFAISWTTIQRKKGDPNNPTPVKKPVVRRMFQPVAPMSGVQRERSIRLGPRLFMVTP